MRGIAVPLALSILCTLAGCSWFGAGAAPVVKPQAIPQSNPFAPVSLRVHPLTRTVIAKSGKPEMVLHVDFRDAWGDSTKGVGALAIRLFGPASGFSGGANQQLQRWDIDLGNLDVNATMFDPATRTYRMQLTGVPDWMTEFASPANGKARPRVVVQVALTPGDGRPPLQDEHVLAK